MSEPTQYRTVTNGMRGVFVVGCALTFFAGFELFVLSEHTDDWFAWTIASPLTATFLGSYYWSVTVGSGLGARESTWATARAAVPGVLVFVWLTGIATLIHLDLFHLDDGPFTARFAAWAWLVIYLAAPPVQTWFFLAQLRTPGPDPPRQPLPSWFRASAIALGIGELLVGVVLFVSPSSSADLWPWALTPLTSRAVAAWLIGHGIVLLCVAGSNGWRAARITMISTLVVVGLQAIALLRYGDEIDWGRPAAVVYGAMLVILFAGGVYGLTAKNQGAWSTSEE